ncbi:MAG TPA: hypothetical protein VK750_03390, partial [Cytophagaceae bacterium]|nr:hypothetical protein [Cytophagaceae bacterium]
MKSLKLIAYTLTVWMQLSLFSTYGQSPVGIGQWRTHYPTSDNAHNLVPVGNRLYCANAISIFYYDKEDKALTSISKKDGLTGTDISRLGSYQSKQLLVGYSDGNIDIVNGNVYTQFNDIQRASITGSKNINHFYTYGNNVFVSTDYGLSIINMDRQEVSDSYMNVTSDGSANIFYASVISQDGDSIYVASQKGILAANYSPGINLRDYNSWKLYDSTVGLPAGTTKSIGRLGNTIFAGVNNKGLYYFDGTQWHSTGIAGTDIRTVSSGDASIVVSLDDKIIQCTSVSASQTFYTNYFNSPYDAFVDNAGTIWFSQPSFGIVYYNPTVQNVGAPNGPSTQDVYRMKYINEQIVSLRGGLNASYGNDYKDIAIMFLSKNDVWTSYGKYSGNGIPPVPRDVMDGAYHPGTNKWYFSTYGYGLLKYDPVANQFSLLDTNTTPALKSMFLSGLTTEADGTVWLCAPRILGTADVPFLYAISPDGSWHPFKAFQANGRDPQGIVIDQQSNKWMFLNASNGIQGLMMFKEINKNTGTSTQVYFGTDDASGALPNMNVNTVDVDKTGQVWVGTNQGICVFTNPSQIKPYSIPKAYLPIVNGFPLFFDKRINIIKVDGANRKWVGTPDGVFLLSSDGLETIHKFDKDNSPLVDNNIYAITINE